MEEENDDIAEEEFKKFFPTINLRNIRIVLFVSATCLFLLSVIMIILASFTRSGDKRTINTISGVVTLVTSIVCIYGGYAKDRGGLQLGYVLLIWELANGSQYFFDALSADKKFSQQCDSLDADARSSLDCNELRRVARGQSVVAVLLFFLALFLSWLVSNFSEKIQDSVSTFQREKDIRFAIENQAMKMRIAKRWKKAYQKVAMGHDPKKSPLMPTAQSGHVASLPPLQFGGALPPLAVGAGSSSGYRNANFAQSSATGGYDNSDEPPKPSGSFAAGSPSVPDKPRRRPGAGQDPVKEI